jgi:hypothetical protein
MLTSTSRLMEILQPCHLLMDDRHERLQQNTKQLSVTNGGWTQPFLTF